jgi:hypothetical protein
LVLSAGAATALSWLAEENAHVRVPQKNPRAEPIKQTLERIKLPPGFKVNLYALVPSARHLAVGPNGQVIFVGTNFGFPWYGGGHSRHIGVFDNPRLSTNTD